VPPESEPESTAKRLYEIRNSLAHDLGAHDDPTQEDPRTINLLKNAWRLEDIVDGLERNLAHPLTVPVVEDRGTTYSVHLGGVYWALHRMLQAALNDRPDEIEAAVEALDLPEVVELPD
jgi:hypothetical protein